MVWPARNQAGRRRRRCRPPPARRVGARAGRAARRASRSGSAGGAPRGGPRGRRSAPARPPPAPLDPRLLLGGRHRVGELTLPGDLDQLLGPRRRCRVRQDDHLRAPGRCIVGELADAARRHRPGPGSTPVGLAVLQGREHVRALVGDLALAQADDREQVGVIGPRRGLPPSPGDRTLRPRRRGGAGRRRS